MAINQVSYDYENVRFDAGKGEFTGAKSISYAHGFENSKEYAAGREAIDSTEGQYIVDDPQVVFSWYEWQNFRDAMGPGYMSKSNRFDVSVSYAHDGEPIVTDILQKCRIKKVERSPSAGADPLEVTVTLECMKILENGLEPMQVA